MEEDNNFSPGVKVDLKVLLEEDEGDESLKKYKQKLLGNMKEIYSPSDDPRKVVIISFSIIFEDRPDLDCDITGLTNSPSCDPVIFKEGCKCRVQIEFRVQHEIVSGLRFTSEIFRTNVLVRTEAEMLGSFAPSESIYTVNIPRGDCYDIPTGMLFRGMYKMNYKFIDDDQQIHLENGYRFQIAKTFPEKVICTAKSARK